MTSIFDKISGEDVSQERMDKEAMKAKNKYDTQHNARIQKATAKDPALRDKLAHTFNMVEDPQIAAQANQANTEFSNLIMNGVIPKEAPTAGTVVSLTNNGQASAKVSTETIRQLAHEPVKEKIKRGQTTVQDYIRAARDAENINRASQGMPEMSPEEEVAQAKKDEGFWGKLGLDGKTALILGATLVAAYKFRDTPDYANAFNGAFENAQARKFAAQQAEAARKEKAKELKDQRDFTAGQNAEDRATRVGMAAYENDQRNYSQDKDIASREYIAKLNNAAEMERTQLAASLKEGKKGEDNVPKMSYEDAVKYSAPLIENKFGGDKVKAKAAAGDVAVQFRQIREGGLEDIAKVTGMTDLNKIQAITKMDDATLIQYLISGLPTKEEKSWLPWRDKKTVLNN